MTNMVGTLHTRKGSAETYTEREERGREGGEERETERDSHKCRKLVLRRGALYKNTIIILRYTPKNKGGHQPLEPPWFLRLCRGRGRERMNSISEIERIGEATRTNISHEM